MRAFGGIMDRVYRWHDAALARLLEAAGPEVTVVLLSDHGFHSDRHRPVMEDLTAKERMERESSWHRPTGVLVMSGPGVVAGRPPVTASILDIAPTALTILGIAVGGDFDGRCLSESLAGQASPERIDSWESVAGDAGLHPDSVRQDPFEASGAIRQLVDLGYMAALPEQVERQIDLVRHECAFNLGASLMTRGRFSEALPHLEALHGECPDEPRYACLYATSLAAVGHLQQAVETMERVIARDPSSLEGRLLLSQCLTELRQHDDARREANRVLKSIQSRFSLAVQLADVLLKQGRTDESLKLYRQIASADRKSIPALLGIARCLLCLRKWDEAASAALDAMEVNKAIPDGHYFLAVALAWIGDLPHARQSADLGLQFDPRHAPMLRLAAVLAQLSGAQSESGELLERAAKGVERHQGFASPAPLPCDAHALAAANGLSLP